MLKFLVVLFVSLLAVCQHAFAFPDISGAYQVKFQGQYIQFQRTPNQQPISGEARLKVTQRNQMITMEFSSIANLSPATRFKGQLGEQHFSALWWYRSNPEETKVVWGQISGQKLTGQMFYPKISGRLTQQAGWLKVSFVATRLAKPTMTQVKTQTASLTTKEDCLEFNPKALAVKSSGNRWLLTNGHSRMKSFENRSEASYALKLILQYNLTQHCFIGRPDPSMEYWLTHGQSPKGMITKEDCLGFNPAKLQLRHEGALWLMTDGRNRMRLFPNRKEAAAALSIIRKYGFNQSCYIGRPHPSMSYFRK
ncbi:hypothetical protein [Dongshaea marina]|uniref:hypothetical protein n=1 Tax=Dongshaea marina TaxID=2047966 RepID=UPI000D3E55E4|nr:hypothetical protein [Dongshaea marina]